MTQNINRIGVFYDGNYFHQVSDYYRYHHPRQSRISISGFHDFLRHEIAKEIAGDTPARFCHIVEAHYYRGRFAAEETNKEEGRLLRERKFDDALMKARVITHFIPMAAAGDGKVRERGIDVLLTLDAYDAALSKKIDFIVLVTGDGDFVPLVERLSSLSCRVVIAAWDVTSQNGQLSVRTAQSLLDTAPHPIMMQTLIEDRSRKLDPLINGMFIDSNLQSESNDDHGVTLNDISVSRDGKKYLGVIVNLPAGRDYGFIAPIHGGDNLFFHASWLEDEALFDKLKVGDRVEFHIGENQKTSQPIALDVIVRST